MTWPVLLELHQQSLRIPVCTDLKLYKIPRRKEIKWRRGPRTEGGQAPSQHTTSTRGIFSTSPEKLSSSTLKLQVTGPKVLTALTGSA